MDRERRTLKRTDRLLALVMFVQGRKRTTVAEMAEHFGVSQRTVFRDLRSLGEAGVPIAYAESFGYEVLKGYHLPPLMFTGRQAAALLMGTEFIKLRSDAAITKEANEVAEKIRAVLSDSIRQYIDALNERTVLDPYWLHKTPAHEYWASISEAIADRRTVWIEYFVRSRKELTRRQVDPLGLVFYTDHWNLIAFDHLRRDMRQFVLEYIQDLQVLTRRFTPPEGFELQEYLRERGANPSGERITVRFPASVYGAARRSIPARIEEEQADADHVTVTFRFENMAYLAQYLLRFGRQVEVLAPIELQRCIRAIALELAEQYAST